MEKSVLYWVGPWKQKLIPQNISVTIETGSINVLGVYIGNDNNKNIKENFRVKLASMRNNLNMWKFRNLTLIGKITLSKSIGMSNLIYSMSMVETPQSIINESQTTVNKFIWGNSPPRVKHKSLMASYDKGGLKAPDITSQVKALRLAWLARITRNKSWCSIANLHFKKYGGLDFLKFCNYDGRTLAHLPEFYQNMLLFLKEIFPNPESYQILWNNRDILIGGNTVYWKTWKNQGIIFICDILDADNNFLSLNDLQEKYGIPFNIMKYNSLLSAIMAARRRYDRYKCISYNTYPNIHLDENTFDSINQNVISFECGRSKVFYQEFVNKLSSIPTSLEYWLEHTTLTLNEFYSSLSLIRASCKESKLIEFHFKIVNNYLNVNRNLYKWKLKDDPNCAFCSKEDSILHNLVRCKITQKWIEEMLIYINNFSDVYVYVTEKVYLFGTKDRAINHIFLLMKYVTWFTKNFEKSFSMNVFKYNLYKRIKADEFYKSNKQFECKWKKFPRLYRNLKEIFE